MALQLGPVIGKIGGGVESVSVVGEVYGITYEVINDFGTVPAGERCLLLLEGEITNSSRFSKPYLRIAGQESPDIPSGGTPDFQMFQVVDGPEDVTVELRASNGTSTATIDVTMYFVFFKSDGA